MQNSVIEELYYFQSENMGISEEYKKLLDKQIKLEKILTKNFSKKMLKLYNKISWIRCDIDSATARSYFIEGFKMGMCLASESFYNNSNQDE